MGRGTKNALRHDLQRKRVVHCVYSRLLCMIRGALEFQDFFNVGKITSARLSVNLSIGRLALFRRRTVGLQVF